MFCPRCGQEQASENTRFCSRCGFLLETVAEVLANGGVLPQLLELNQKKTLLTRKNGILFSFFWLLFFVFLTALVGSLGNNSFSGIMALIAAFGWLIFLLASIFLLKKSPQKFSQENYPAGSRKNVSGAPPNNLPPQSQPVNDYVSPANNWKVPNTNEFVATPPIVTESTTKLLNKDE